MSYYTYEGDSLVLANDPPNAVYVPRDDGYGNFRYYILDSAGRMVGSTLTAPPAGTRVAPASAMNENGQIDILQIPEIAGRSATTPQMADIQNSLAQGGIYNSPDGRYSIIGGGDANTPGLPSAFAGAPRILVSGGGSADGVVPPEIAAAFSLAPQGEQQRFAQQKATYEAGEGKAPTFGDAALAAVGSYFGGQALGGMLGGGEALGGATYLGGDAMSASGIGAGGITGAEVAGAGGAYPYGMGPAGTGIGTGNPYMFAGEVPPGSLSTGTVNNLGGGLDISGGLDAPGGFYSTPVEVQPGFDPNNIAGQATYGESMSSALRNPFGLGAAGTGLAAQLSGTAGEAVGAGAASGMLQQLMAATGLSEKQLMGLGAAGISSLTSLYGASQIGKAATTAANIGAGATDRATALQTQMYQDQLSRSQPFYQAGVNALGPYTKGIMGSSEDQAAGRPGSLVRPFDPNKDYIQSPYYQVNLTQKLKDYTNKLASMGLVDSGPMRRGVLDIAGRTSQEDITNAYNRYNQDLSTQRNALGNLAGYGPPATAVQNAASSNYATNVGNLGMSAAGTQANAGLTAAQANQSAYGNVGNAFANYLAPNPMNEFFQNQLNRRPVV